MISYKIELNSDNTPCESKDELLHTGVRQMLSIKNWTKLYKILLTHIYLLDGRIPFGEE